MRKKSSIQDDIRKIENCNRSIYIKASLKIAVYQKCFIKIFANSFENAYNKCGAGLQPGTYFTRSFIFTDFLYTLGTPTFRNI